MVRSPGRDEGREGRRSTRHAEGSPTRLRYQSGNLRGTAEYATAAVRACAAIHYLHLRRRNGPGETSTRRANVAIAPHDATLELMDSVVVRDPAIMSGEPTFRGTRVLVRTLFDYLEAGHSLERFLEGFPTVTRVMALQALEEAKESLLASR